MSINIHVRATREIIVVSTNVKEIQTQVCNMIWQTPSVVSRKIMESTDPKQAYFDWVLSRSKDVKLPVYDEKDIFQEWDAIGHEVVNYGKIHVDEVSAWIEIMTKKGYEIIFESY